ncbi:MAG: 30S ribosomal protein S16, partial [Parvicellaceae bacterium]
MATKIRLARHGKKGKPYFHIVTADARAPRDGKYIERIGSYNPNTNPATIDVNFERALHWVSVGAIPTDTVRAMLSYKGVMYKNHLLKGVKKGAHTAEQAEEKFAAWMKDKETKIEAKISSLQEANKKAKSDKLASEKEKNDARAAEVAATQAAELAAIELAAIEEAKTEESASDELSNEEPVAEEAKVEELKAEEPAAEEAKVEEVKAEEPAAEEAKVEEVKAEEPAAEEA